MTAPGRKLFASARQIRISDRSSMVFVSGVICREPDSRDKAGRQAEWIFARIADVLSEYKGSLEDIVHLRCYLVDVNDYDAYNNVRARLWEKLENLPASSTICAAALLGIGTRLEVEAVAIVAA